MKKTIICALLALILLSGCSKKIVCGECGREASGKTYTVELWGFSTKEDICNDCIKNVKQLAKALGGSVK